MMRILVSIALFVATSASAQMWPFPGPGRPAAGGGGGGPPNVAWVDSFTRSPSPTTNITASCASEGPNNACEWTEVTGDVSISSNALLSTPATFLLASALDTTTLAQYSGAKYTGSTSNVYQGPSVRGNGLGTANDCHYAFRFNTITDYALRACDTGSRCVTLATLTSGAGDFTDMLTGDSLGLSVDTGTGDSVKFTVYKFDAQVAPAAFSDWAAASTSYTVCASGGGCAKTWATSPSAAYATLTNPASGCTEAAGKRVGLYSGQASAGTWDDWRGGDTN